MAEERGAALMQRGATGVQEDWLPGQAPAPRQPWDTGPPPPLPERVVLRAWFENLSNAERDRVSAHLSTWVGCGEAAWSPVATADWAQAWRAGFRRIAVGPGLVVAPPWEAQAGDLVIEPGMAFGTGEHPTTLACLRAVLALAPGVKTILDVGCGTGVLALAGAQAGLRAVGMDIDPDAVRAAHENAARNGLKAHFSTESLARLGPDPFDLVVANLYAEVLVDLAPEILPLVGRHLVLAGVLADRAHLVESAFAELGPSRRQQEGEWVCLAFCR